MRYEKNISKDFENECANEQIPLYVLPPASPKYNGNVERFNRTCRTEFYSLPIFAENVAEMNLELERYLKK